MKIPRLILFAILSSCVILYSCNNCSKVDCDGNSGFVRIQLLRNGNNILYGPDAIIEKDRLVVFAMLPNLYEGHVNFLDTFQAVSFSISPHAPIVLEINGVRADTFRITTEVTSMSECCTGYTTTSISHNGQVICTDNCDEILAVEI